MTSANQAKIVSSHSFNQGQPRITITAVGTKQKVPVHLFVQELVNILNQNYSLFESPCIQMDVTIDIK